MGSSVSVSLADEQENEREEIATTRVTNRGAAKQIKTVIRGGLTESQILLAWDKVHAREPAKKEVVKIVMKSLVDDYPNLLQQSVDIAFHIYARASGSEDEAARTKKELVGALNPVFTHIKKAHSATGAANLTKVAAEQTEALKITGTIEPVAFARRFQEEIGPALAERFMGGDFNDSLLDDLSNKYYNRLKHD